MVDVDSPADDAYEHLDRAYRFRHGAAADFGDFRVLELVRAGAEAFILLTRAREPNRVFALRISLTDPDGTAHKLDLPPTHLAAFVRSGAIAGPDRERTALGNLTIVDASDYL